MSSKARAWEQVGRLSVFLPTIALAVSVAALSFGCAGEEPSRRESAVAYLQRIRSVAERDYAASTAFNEQVFDWEDPTTWAPAIGAGRRLQAVTENLCGEVSAIEPPIEFADAHAKLNEVYAISDQLVTTLVGGMAAKEEPASIFLAVQQLAARQFSVNAEFIDAVRTAADLVGAELPASIPRAYPSE